MDVRYDFRKKHGKGEGRLGNPNEIDEMKKEIETLLKVTSRLKSLLK